MKSRGIRFLALMLAIVPAVLVAVLLAILFLMDGLGELENSLRDRGLAIVRQLAPASEYGAFSGNREVLQSLAQSVMTEADVRSVVILDNRGKVLAVSGRPLAPLSLGSDADGPRYLTSDDGRVMTFRMPSLRSELDVGGVGKGHGPRRVLGVVSVELSTESTRERRSHLVRNGILAVLLALASGVALARRLSRRVIEPVQKLVEGVGQMARGNLDVRVPEASGGELGVLESGFNRMAANLQTTHENMQERIREATARLSHQASHDALTGLVNRREFELRLERALSSARDKGLTHVMCYMDLDQFKVVNDTCGHGAGDELLRQLTFLLRERLRDRDTLARLGGDEFGLLLENCTVDDARRVAEDIRQMVGDFRFAWQGRIFAVGMSIGLVAVTAESASVAGILSAADAACYAAKDRGRNRLHVYEESDTDLKQRHGEMQWVSRIQQALEEGRFCLYRQPILPLGESTERPRHELLVRMRDEYGALVPPMAFIPAAERYNLMPAVDRWVIDAALAGCRRFDGSDGCAINLSAASLSDPSLPDYIRESLTRHGVAAGRICFEITETAAIASLSEALPVLHALKRLGCLIALDDFGSGMSSFAYLKSLPVDFLKIDGSIVREMADNTVAFTTVQAIHNIAQAMGVRTVAEFVESEEVAAQLTTIGVHYGQGFWLGPPLPLDGA